VDDYRWLENFDDPEVRAWSDAQNAYARSVLDALPNLAAISRRISELEHARSSRYSHLIARNGTFFAMKLDPSKQQPVLVTLKSLDDLSSERVIVDPNTIDPRGATAMDFYSPSLDAKKVAVSLSGKGSELGDAHVYEVETGKELKRDSIPRISTYNGEGIAWASDGTGFFYVRYPRPGERRKADLEFYQQIYFHKLGSAVDRDEYSLGKQFPRIAQTQLKSSPDGKYVLAVVANGDGGDHALYVWRARRGWAQVAKFEDHVTTAELGADQAVYILSRADAPRGQILRVALSSPSMAKAQIVVKQGEHAISAFAVTQSRIYTVMQLGGPSAIHVFDLSGNRLSEIPAAPVSRADDPVRLPKGDDIYFYQASYLTPSAWFAYSAADGRVTKTKLAESFPADLSGMTVVREFATSKDGTRVPLNIIYPKTVKLDGSAPALLYGYGGYGISLSPDFVGTIGTVWLEQGGLYAIANLRGGGEFGDEWHRAGNLTRKQNVFDDFYACAKLLAERGYVDAKRLGIVGGSNGGLLMGAALTQHPEKYRAVLSMVGIYDMLRVETEPNGEYNVTEFGTVKEPEQFRALFGYSPYHHVKDGTPYPAVLFVTGANDRRVNPEHSRKMTARLQSATSSKLPVLLRTSATTGHGIGTPLDERIAELTDEFAFFFAQLGVTYKVPPIRSATGGSSK
jgi:prolyl oligopeptidase